MPSIELLLEAERRGILPPEKLPFLNEARNRGLIPSALEESTISPTQQQPVEAQPAAPTLEFGGGQTRGAGATGTIPLSAREVATGAIQTFPGAALEAGKAIAQPFIHPIQTAKSIGMIANGAFQLLVPGEHPDEAAIKALVGYFGDRYGGVENIKQTIATDLPGFLMDLSAAATLGGGALSKVGKLSKIARAGRVGKVARGIGTAGRVIGKAGKAIDPLRAAGAVISRPLRLVGAGGKRILGNIMSGAGAETIAQQFKRAPDFVRGLKGELDLSDVLREARGGLQNIKTARSALYRSRLANIKKATKNLDINPIKKQLLDKLDDFEIKLTPKGLEREISFANSTVTSAGEIDDIMRIWDDVMRWEQTPGNLTPRGMDILKRRIDNYFVQSRNSHAITTSVRNKIKETIVKEVPEYAQMTRDYQQVQNFIEEIEKGLSLGRKASMDTGVRKLATLMKSNKDFRRGLLEELQKAVPDVDMKAAIAGVTSRQWKAEGIIGSIVQAGAGLNVVYGGLASVSPAVAIAVASSSPRALAAFMNALGKAARTTRFGIERVVQPAFQVGRGVRAIEQQPQPSPLESTQVR